MGNQAARKGKIRGNRKVRAGRWESHWEAEPAEGRKEEQEAEYPEPETKEAKAEVVKGKKEEAKGNLSGKPKRRDAEARKGKRSGTGSGEPR